MKLSNIKSSLPLLKVENLKDKAHSGLVDAPLFVDDYIFVFLHVYNVENKREKKALNEKVCQFLTVIGSS